MFPTSTRTLCECSGDAPDSVAGALAIA